VVAFFKFHNLAYFLLKFPSSPNFPLFSKLLFSLNSYFLEIPIFSEHNSYLL